MPDVETEADRQRFRAVMGHFATGVAVVTGMGSEGAVGMTTTGLRYSMFDLYQAATASGGSAARLASVP